jgi:hypothetical protein
LQWHTYDPEGRDHDTEDTHLTRFDHHFGSIGRFQLVRPLVVGMARGLAGSAAVGDSTYFLPDQFGIQALHRLSDRDCE